MLNSNADKVKNLTGAEIWLFIIGRVLIAFGVGILSMRYFPGIAGQLAIPALAVGLILFSVATKGLFRKPISS